MPEYVKTSLDRDPEFVFQYLQSHPALRERYVFKLTVYYFFNEDAGLEADG